MGNSAEERCIEGAIAAPTTDLAAMVQSQLAGRVRDFQMVITERGVVLRGRANNYHAKQLAQHAVMLASELPILANEIEVS